MILVDRLTIEKPLRPIRAAENINKYLSNPAPDNRHHPAR